jgi:hypothetical protein
MPRYQTDCEACLDLVFDMLHMHEEDFWVDDTPHIMCNSTNVNFQFLMGPTFLARAEPHIQENQMRSSVTS